MQQPLFPTHKSLGHCCASCQVTMAMTNQRLQKKEYSMRFLSVIAFILPAIPAALRSRGCIRYKDVPCSRKQQRVVIRLPKLSHEENSKVELLVGQQKEVDCNLHRMSGDLQERSARMGIFLLSLGTSRANDQHIAWYAPPNKNPRQFYPCDRQRLPVVITVNSRSSCM